MLRDVYQANTRNYWNGCTDIADESDYRLGGAFNDGGTKAFAVECRIAW